MEQIISLLNKNNFTTEIHESNQFSILKASFGQYYYYLFIWDKKDFEKKDLKDLEKARSDFYKNKNVHKKILSILVYNKAAEKKINSTIYKQEGKNDFKFGFFHFTGDELINFLKDDIYDNHFCLFCKAFIFENNKNFIQFMKNNVKNPEDIDKYSIKFVALDLRPKDQTRTIV
ncbi:34059_t:CDS:1, partial [Gigaspora margarita]